VAEGPKRVALTEAFHEAMSRQRLVAAVFLTYRFDPGFFEQEVLPAFFDRPFSSDPKVKLAQLEAVLQGRPGSLAVYYDANGLKGGEEPAKLDVGRFPVRLERGIFHPKNVFALVEADEPDEEGRRPRKLLAACLSANLTQAGWWRNLEAAHIEEIEEKEEVTETFLADDLRPFLKWLREQPATQAPQKALDEIRAFLDKRANRFETATRRSRDGMLLPRFYWGRSDDGTPESVVQFLKRTTKRELQGWRMEVVSPYFDEADECEPLTELRAAFSPSEMSVFLPRDGDGKGTVDPRIWDDVAEVASWGRFPKDVLKMGKAEDVALRTVHAKVVRFFSLRPKREVWFVGSANLTRAAFSGKANRETGFLVEVDDLPPGPLDFWLETDKKKPKEFEVGTDPDEPAASGGTRLQVQHDWSVGETKAFWDGPKASPALVVSSNGVEVFRVDGLPSRAWQALPADDSRALAERLKSTSIFEVTGEDADGKPGLLLVQEIGMFRKPSLAPERTAADILKDWAAPSDDRRVEMFEGVEGAPAVPAEPDDRRPEEELAPVASLFDRFAGIFHGFTSLERRLVEQLNGKNDEGAAYLLFGTTFNSLATFLKKEKEEEIEVDPVNVYVAYLCAKQLVATVKREAGAVLGGTFLDRHGPALKELEAQVEEPLGGLRQLIAGEIGSDGAKFLDWFDRWFLRRATPAGEAA
jgi:hypothetical protein